MSYFKNDTEITKKEVADDDINDGVII
jgi:hypothetical protein